MQEEGEYRMFTGPQQLCREVHYLEGLLNGITIDRQLTQGEVDGLHAWCIKHAGVADRHPFNEIIPMLEAALEDHIITAEERADVLWCCEKFSMPNEFFSTATIEMQQLHGALAGIAMDGVITKEELRGLRTWIENHKDLKGTWPYDDIDSLILAVLADGKIDEDEHRFLLQFCSEFIEDCPFLILENPLSDDFLRGGVCASCPEIEFPGRIFCFTGKSAQYSRNELASIAESLGATASNTLTKSTDYLIVGAEGSDCWTFSCYGRKIEEAMKRRREGARIVIVDEFDFLDAARDLGALE